MPACVIGGVGLVTPLGAGAQATWDALLAGRFIDDHARATLPTPPTMPRVMALSHAAAAEALADARWADTHLSDPQTALIVGTSKGPVESWLSPTAATSDNLPPAGGLQPTGISQIASSLAARFNITGPALTLSAACASGLHALIRAALLIRSGQARRVLVVATEASVHPLFLGCFHRLGVLPPTAFGCRPFDQTRQGFLMSEAAAAVCLTAEDDVSATRPPRPSPQATTSHAGSSHAGPAPGRIALDRFALGADAFHLTGSDPGGRVLRHLLRTVTQDAPFDLIHAHGTGTQLNDAIELAALNDTFTDPASLPILYSHKGALGHSLGAAGLVAIVLNCLAHRTGVIPPNIQTHSPLPTHLPIPHTSRNVRVRRSLALAAGFGGPTAVVSLKTV